MKALLLKILLFIGVFGGINLLVAMKPVQKFFLKMNPLDYFYTGHDWSLKLSRVRDLGSSGTSIALGTSRTALLLDPEVLDVENLGLIAASYDQVLHLARELARKEIRYSRVYIEVNPIALSRRFSRHTEIADYGSVLASPDSFLSTSLGRRLYRSLPILRYRSVLAGTLKESLGYAPSVSPEIQNLKREFQLEQFFRVDDDDARGFVSSPVVENREFREKLLESCVLTSHWALGKFDPDEGLKDLREAVKLLGPKSDEIILWIPPSSPEWESELEGDTRNTVTTQVSSWGLPVIDLSRDEARSLWFNDCIHASSSGARHYSRRLREEEEKIHGK